MGRDEGGQRVMRRILCGTTALVVAGLTAGNASAASGLKLGITGFFRNAIGASWGNGPQATFPRHQPLAAPPASPPPA